MEYRYGIQKLAASAAKARKRQEAVQRKKAEAERQAKRETYLRTLAADFDQCWQAADKRAERGIVSAYDEVVRARRSIRSLCSLRSPSRLRSEAGSVHGPA